MNETEFVNSRVIDAVQPRLPIILTNRRFLVCFVIGAAIFLSTLASIREIENIPVPEKAPLLVLKPRPAIVPEMMVPSLQLQRAQVPEGNHGERFEVGFGITQAEHSPAPPPVETAKYDTDRLTFGAHKSMRDVPAAAQFEFNNGRITRVSSTRQRSHYDSSSPSMCIPERMSVGLDVDVEQGGTYVGILFVVPLGD